MTRSENPYAGQGSVLLDIGGDIGALVVRMPGELEGVEVEINRIDQHDHDHRGHESAHHDHRHERDPGHGPHRPHVAVVPRPAATGVIHSLVFPELLEGRYELYQRPDGPVQLNVSITGGAVTEVAWPT